MAQKKPMTQPREQAKSARKPPANSAEKDDGMQSKGSKASEESRSQAPMKKGNRPQSR